MAEYEEFYFTLAAGSIDFESPFLTKGPFPPDAYLTYWPYAQGRGKFPLANMTFAHYDFVRSSSISEHFHPEEEVYEVIEGELEITVDGVAQIARAGLVAIMPGNVRNSVKALTDGRAIIVDSPARHDFA